MSLGNMFKCDKPPRKNLKCGLYKQPGKLYLNLTDYYATLGKKIRLKVLTLCATHSCILNGNMEGKEQLLFASPSV